MIQVAGVRNENDLQVLIDAGVEFIGFPLRLNFHQEDAPDTHVRDFIQLLPDTITPVLITYLNQCEDVLKLAKFIGVDLVQIHSEIAKAELVKIKEASTLQVIKSLVVKEENFEELKDSVAELADLVDFFITDTFDPKSGAEGATGLTHDWNISRELVKLSPKPVILAGGLNPSNVEEAIKRVNPAGVDSHTGLEDPDGYKDPSLVKAFVDRSRSAFQSI